MDTPPNNYTPAPSVAEQISRTYTYAAPKADQPERYVSIRAGAKELAEFITRACPPSRELSLALTHLEQTVMYANAAIARYE